MCIKATVNGSTVEYALTSTGKANLGYMAMGFGQTMANSPMVIMWENSGTFMLSQRQATGEVTPTIVDSPDRVATVEKSASVSASNNVATYTYTIPSDGTTGEQNVIFAYSDTQPDGDDSSASIIQHIDSGAFKLNLSGSPSNSSSSNSSSSSSGSSSEDDSTPLLSYQKVIVAHAILLTVGFLFFLPTGVIVARYLRTTTPSWFQGHWIANFFFGTFLPPPFSTFFLSSFRLFLHFPSQPVPRFQRLALLCLLAPPLSILIPAD